YDSASLFLSHHPPIPQTHTLSLHDALPISFWNPTPAAVPPSARSVITTPAVSASRCSSSATAGEIFATLAPCNGERPLRTISLRDRKSTRLNSSHGSISYAVFCLKKKKKYN